MTEGEQIVLGVEDLYVGYGSSLVIQGVSLHLKEGEAVALLGRNGMGKTTLLHALAGLVTPQGGEVTLDGKTLSGRPDQIARAGLTLVPQGRRIFAPLTVEENLRLSLVRASSGQWSLEQVYELLPRLRERRTHKGDQLSGGEQQMLAIGRALLRNPRVLLLDEPSEGLAPMLVNVVRDLLLTLREAGLSILLVEQHIGLATAIGERILGMDRGKIVLEKPVEAIHESSEELRALLSV